MGILTKEDIESIKNKIAALRLKYSKEIGKIHRRKKHESDMFHLELGAIQATCEHPEKSEYGLGKHEECMVCGKVWSLF